MSPAHERANALIQQGNTHYHNEAYEEAIAAYRQAIRLCPEPAYQSFYLVIGDMLQVLQHYDEAVHAYHDLLAVHPDHTDGWRGLGACLMKQGRNLSALQAFEHALALEPDDLQALYVAAVLHTLLAEQHVRHLLELQPEWEVGARQDALLQRHFGG